MLLLKIYSEAHSLGNKLKRNHTEAKDWVVYLFCPIRKDMWVKLDILLESSCEMFGKTQHAWKSKRTRSVKREMQALKRWRHKSWKTIYLYHALEILPIRIEESRCIFDGIQLNLPIVLCVSYSRLRKAAAKARACYVYQENISDA